ncbi:MAG: PEGA domain-containing protein [Deltaproteobacteria bacterium]|nr:PEGA domain-containing protein [Deltaproteobacteria bacterium]
MSERPSSYEHLRHIATGGMAEIHLARHRGLGGDRLVVVKRMLPELAVRPDFVTMFQDEARLTSTLVHPNIVRVFELGEQAGTYFIAMELIDGPHLGALFAHSLRARAPLPLDLCCWIVARAADGLHYAHGRQDPATGASLNLVHRDISPQNILVGRFGEVKVIDFGVAKASTQQTKTRTGLIKGKVAYMSPEQCLSDNIDRRTDVFALGIVLYELVTRRRLFHHLKSDMLVMQEITEKDIPPASTVNPDVDPRLNVILARALSRDLAGRFANAAELTDALDDWLAGRVSERALAVWFEANCVSLALSAQTPIEAAAPVPAGAAETTTVTPSTPEIVLAAARPSAEATVVTAPPVPTPAAQAPVAAAPALVTSREPTDTIERVRVAEGPRAAEPRRVRAASLSLAFAVVVAVIGAAVIRGGAGDAAVIQAPPPPPLPAPGRLRVETTPPGVTILAGDDRVLGKSPVDVELPPGPVHLQAQFADQPPRAVDVDINAGEATTAVIHAWVPLVVRSTPPRAKVRIDGELRGETPFQQGFLVGPGKAVIVRLEAAGFQPWEEQRTASPGAPLEVVAKLAPATAGLRMTAAARDDFGAIRVNIDPWAIVEFDDTVLGEAPFNDKRVRAGRHLLTLTNPEVGLKDAFEITIAPKRTLMVILRYEKRGTVWVQTQKNIR